MDVRRTADIRNTQKAEAAELPGMEKGTQNSVLSTCPFLIVSYLPLKFLRAESKEKFRRVRGAEGEMS